MRDKTNKTIGSFIEGQPLGLIGAVYSGKTVYMATLYNQLVHSTPDWQVKVGKDVTDLLHSNYRILCETKVPVKTTRGTKFQMQIVYRKQKLDLLMIDPAGENCHLLAESEVGKDFKASVELLKFLCKCKSIMVTFLSRYLEGYCKDSDQEWSDIFQRILKQKNCLRQVIVIIIGIEVYEEVPAIAESKAINEFKKKYRVFPSIVKEAGVELKIVPISNFGFANLSLVDPYKPRRAPQPYNVLKPLELALPHYLPWKKRMTSILIGIKNRANWLMSEGTREKQTTDVPQQTRAITEKVPEIHPEVGRKLEEFSDFFKKTIVDTRLAGQITGMKESLLVVLQTKFELRSENLRKELVERLDTVKEKQKLQKLLEKASATEDLQEFLDFFSMNV